MPPQFSIQRVPGFIPAAIAHGNKAAQQNDSGTFSPLLSLDSQFMFYYKQCKAKQPQSTGPSVAYTKKQTSSVFASLLLLKLLWHK
jgi:hypothetical protein